MFSVSALINPHHKAKKCTALAIQGGGAHGAFAWGVVDRLLEDGLRPDALCGVSSGALIAAGVTQGWVHDGAQGARRSVRRLWELIGHTHMISPMRNGPLERWLWGWDLSNSPAWAGLEAAMRLWSPAQLNPLGHNPLRGIIDSWLDRDALASAGAPKLFVGVTDVQSGGAVMFGNAAITADVLAASCCLPFVFPAVQINGRAYWDGGYSGNPPLRPLLDLSPSRLVLVRAQAQHRPGVPDTQAEILNRLNEIACQNVLEAELAVLPAGISLDNYDASEALVDLPISSKFNPEPDFLGQLFKAGRAAAEAAKATVA